MQDIISTLKNALQQAEAGLEVAVGRLAKDGTERGDFKPSEVLALACVREALAMPVSCLHQIQEPAAAEQAAWHAGLDEGRAQAAPAAVAVPDLQDMLRELRVQIHKITIQLAPTSDCSGVWMAHDKMSTALAASLAADAKPFLSEDDLDDLRRFEGMASDGESYDIAKKRMKRLAELGVVRWVGGSRYCMTAFGQYVLKCWDHLPLETHEEANARANAEFRARIGRLNAEAIASQSAQGG